MLELLAPAKDKKCAFAAIDYGADAVYVGANDFGARKNAANSLEDLKEIIDYAHLFNVKVYVTLNTILNDGELKKAEKLVKELEDINADALIIQDMGLCETQHKIPFHASTQCNNRTVEKVKILEQAGFERVVLARELSLEQIKEIKKQTNVELETFIHGALCVSYSGQCYLSYAIGGRSANKGECAQPCRKKYTLSDDKGNVIAKDKYLLSLKDFNASDYLKEFDKIGVTSLKIEGRLKDENYVKNVVGFYRKKINELKIKMTSVGHINFDFEPKLEKSFNRGFTDYFLNKRHNCFSFDTQKALGESLGKIKEVGKNYFVLEKNIKLNSQDGICFFDKNELKGCLVNKFENNRVYPNNISGIKKGMEIYRNQDTEFEKTLKNSKTKRKIFVEFEISDDKIKAIDETGIFAEITFNSKEPAQNPVKMLDSIEKSFRKTNDTIYETKNIVVNATQLPFFPASELNEIRRNLIKTLTETRLKSYKVKRCDYKTKYPQINKTLDYKANIMNEKAKTFYEKCGCEISETALESDNLTKNKIVMTTKHCLKYAFNMCKSDTNLYLTDEKGKKYKLKFNCKKCEMEIVY